MAAIVVEGDLLDQQTGAIGAGSGGLTTTDVEGIMLETLRSMDSPLRVVVVRYRALHWHPVSE